jgi:hypothetical protein
MLNPGPMLWLKTGVFDLQSQYLVKKSKVWGYDSTVTYTFQDL